MLSSEGLSIIVNTSLLVVGSGKSPQPSSCSMFWCFFLMWPLRPVIFPKVWSHMSHWSGWGVLLGGLGCFTGGAGLFP